MHLYGPKIILERSEQTWAMKTSAAEARSRRTARSQDLAEATLPGEAGMLKEYHELSCCHQKMSRI